MKQFLFAIFLLGSLSPLMSQARYGHLNFGQLLSIMPQTQGAEASLEAYQKQLVAQGEAMAAKFQADYTEYLRQAQGGDLTPVQQQKMQTDLQAQQQAIVAYEEEMTQLINKKREELITPIIDRAREAIKMVAQANKFVMVFDTSIFNAILFAGESEDVMPLVKTQLGIQ